MPKMPVINVIGRISTEMTVSVTPASNANGNGHAHAAVVTLAAHDVPAKASKGNGNGHPPTGETGTKDLRTPRRLGHQIR